MTIETGGRPGLDGPGLFTVGWWAIPTGKSHGSGAKVYFTFSGSSTTVIPYLKAVTLSMPTETKDVTPLGQLWRSLWPQERNATFTFEGFYDETFNGQIEATLQTLTGFRYAPAGETISRVRYSASARLTKLEISSGADQTNNVTGELTVTGRLAREVLV